jgi:hypothetical protein
MITAFGVLYEIIEKLHIQNRFFYHHIAKELPYRKELNLRKNFSGEKSLTLPALHDCTAAQFPMLCKAYLWANFKV